MKIKTSVLIGDALDWAVAKCEGIPVYEDRETLFAGGWIEFDELENPIWILYEYSSDWAYGGPIIERGEITLTSCNGRWEATRAGYLGTGFTPLVASMRCYVCSRLGEEIEIPDEF